MFRIVACLFLSFIGTAYTAVTFDESRAASTVIGKWLSRSTGHFDFYSATPVAPKRAGERFMITVVPSKQFASDYGLSYQQITRDQNVNGAYQTLGFNTDEFSKTIELSRIHANFGITNKYDLTLSYLFSPDKISGWGVGFKNVLFNYRHLYFSHRIQAGHSKLEAYFDNWVMVNDLSMSLYFTLVDFYGGVRHSAGKVRFYSAISALNLPPINYVSSLSELEYFYGVVLAPSFNTRLTFQANKNGEELSLGAKFSFHFDSILPSASGWFKDPRYIKQ